MSMDDQKIANVEDVKARWQAARPIMAGVVLAVSLTASAALAVMQTRFETGYVEIGDGIKVAVTVADNPTTREKGLSGKEGLAADEGMLFIFDRADRYAFWMKEMRFAIDILWIKDDVIADMTTDVAPSAPGDELPMYFPRVPVDRVLEVPAGFARRHGLSTGMAVTAHIDKRGETR